MTKIRADVRISGRVQGVCFRHFTQQIAKKHGVGGWCRNRPEGSVEAVFEGEETAVRAVVDWCRQGPDLARVDEVQIAWNEASDEFRHFEIR
jgi:acylphosphatase